MKLMWMAMTGAVLSLVSAVAASAEDLPPALPAAMTDAPCTSAMPRPPGNLDAVLKPGAKAPMPAPDPTSAEAQAFSRWMAEQRSRDFAARCRFQADNAKRVGKTRVVLMGDSITEFWAMGDPSLFAPDLANRGISGQTTPQMVIRFYQDVVALRPAIVHIMAGTNNLAGNTGPNSPEDFRNDIRAMVDLARANGIKVVLASIPPADTFGWRPDLRPAAQIQALNTWLKSFAQERGITYVDYYSAMATPTGGMKPELTNDGVHPNTKGYAVMHPLFAAAVQP